MKCIESTLRECGSDVDVLMVERTSTANRIFASMMFEQGSLSECEWLLYNHLFDDFAEKSKHLLHGIVYLDCPLQTAMDRIKSRDRKGESVVTHEYQAALTSRYEKWLAEERGEVPMWQIRVPYDERENDMMAEIDQFIAKTMRYNR